MWRQGEIERQWRGSVFVGASLDGYIARPTSDLDWLTDPPQGRSHKAVSSDAKGLEWDTFYPRVDHLLMGRATYEKVLTFGDWPYQGKGVIVLSSSLSTSDPRVTITRSLAEACILLEERQALWVYIDGGQVIQSCLAADLVDEVTVAFAPVLIGEGIPLFGALAEDILLRLEGTHATPGGMVHLTYGVHRGE